MKFQFLKMEALDLTHALFKIAGQETSYFLLKMENIEGSLKTITTEGKFM